MELALGAVALQNKITGDEKMFLFRDQKENELNELLIQAYQLNRNELIARVQQRDQYIICIIGAIVAMLVGLFEVSTNENSSSFVGWILIGCLVVWIALVMLTYRFFNSYHIHNLLIEHTKNIERIFSERHTTKLKKYKLELWQTFVDNSLPKHRPNSYTYTASFFIFLNFVLLLVWSCIGTIKIIDAIPVSIGIHNIPVFAISVASAIATVTNVYLWGNNILDPKGVLIPKVIKSCLMRIKKILLYFLPLLIAVTACLVIRGFNANTFFPRSPHWLSDLLNLLIIFCVRGSEYVVGMIVKIFSEQTNNNTANNPYTTKSSNSEPNTAEPNTAEPNANNDNDIIYINYKIAYFIILISYSVLINLNVLSMFTLVVIGVLLFRKRNFKLYPKAAVDHRVRSSIVKYIVFFLVIITCSFVINHLMPHLLSNTSDIAWGMFIGVVISLMVISGLHFIYKRILRADNSVES